MHSHHIGQQLDLAIHQAVKNSHAQFSLHHMSNQEQALRIVFRDRRDAYAFSSYLRDKLELAKIIDSDDSRRQYSIDLQHAEIKQLLWSQNIRVAENVRLENVNKYQGLKPAELAVLEIIKGHRALVKVISDYGDTYQIPDPFRSDYTEIDFYLDQIVDPVKNRPSRSANFYQHVGQDKPEEVTKINLKTKEIHVHQVGKCRDTRHKGVDFQHTLKTATTLLPPEPAYMEVYEVTWIGFLWDSAACDLKKEKYIWHLNAVTDAQFWYDVKSPNDPQLRFSNSIFCSLEELRAINNAAIEKQTVIVWNEILAGFPKGRVDALFAPLDILEVRLRAWNTMLHTKERLKLADDLPVLVMEAGKPHRIYTAEERERDLHTLAAMNAKKNHGVFAAKQKSSAVPVQSQSPRQQRRVR